MSITKYADEAAREILQDLDVSTDDDKTAMTSRAIERAIIKAVLDVRSQCVDVALDCAAADKDMAHKIADQIRQANNVLIANLSSMR